MLTESQKAVILAKAGIEIPPFPARSLPIQERYLRAGARVPQAELDADSAQRSAAQAWRLAVEALYVRYVAERSAKSLQTPDDGSSLAHLRSLT
jgi:hypothetical protein